MSYFNSFTLPNTNILKFVLEIFKKLHYLTDIKGKEGNFKHDDDNIQMNFLEIKD